MRQLFSLRLYFYNGPISRMANIYRNESSGWSRTSYRFFSFLLFYYVSMLIKCFPLRNYLLAVTTMCLSGRTSLDIRVRASRYVLKRANRLDQIRRLRKEAKSKNIHQVRVRGTIPTTPTDAARNPRHNHLVGPPIIGSERFYGHDDAWWARGWCLAVVEHAVSLIVVSVGQQ